MGLFWHCFNKFLIITMSQSSFYLVAGLMNKQLLFFTLKILAMQTRLPSAQYQPKDSPLFASFCFKKGKDISKTSFFYKY